MFLSFYQNHDQLMTLCISSKIQKYGTWMARMSAQSQSYYEAPLYREGSLSLLRIDTVLDGLFLLYAGVEPHTESVPLGIKRGLMGPISK